MAKKILLYEIRYTIFEDGSTELARTCDGFDAWQLLGLLDLTIDEVRQQISGQMKQPDVIKRTYVQPQQEDKQ